MLRASSAGGRPLELDRMTGDSAARSLLAAGFDTFRSVYSPVENPVDDVEKTGK
jgi:hypothetical protein